jgi:phytoene synthase
MSQNYLQQEIAPRGSSLYYSLLGLPEAKRQGIIALQGFYYEIMKTAERYKEPAVAQAKLTWWETEIKALHQGKPNHPITQMLLPYRKYTPEAALLAIIAAARLSMEVDIYPTQAELSHHYQHTGGLLELLKARVLADGNTDLDTEQYAQTLGIALDTIRHLQDMAWHLHQGHIYLPADQLQANHIGMDALFQNPKLDSLQAALKQQAQYAREQYALALKRLPKTQVILQNAGRIYANIRLAELAALEQQQFVTKRDMLISPLKKLWIAWRNK